MIRPAEKKEVINMNKRILGLKPIMTGERNRKIRSDNKNTDEKSV